MTHTTSRTALHIIHGYNEPFLSLSNLYSRALQSDGWRVVTVYLSGRADETIRAKTITDQVIFFEASDTQMKGLKLGLICRVRQLIQQHAASLIVAQRYKPLYLALLGSVGRTIPVLGVAHAFGVLNNRSRRYLLHSFRRRLTLVGVSQSVTNDLQRNGSGLHIQALRIQALPNAIDSAALEPQLLTREAARAQLQLTADDFVFANVGRLHDDKDQSTLIRAFARIATEIPHAKLLLMGKGKREARYRAQIEALQLQGRAILMGAVPNAATLFRALDVYVSTSDHEPFGIVLTEAMLAHLPVISTDCGGAPEVLGECAQYFSRGDDTALAEKMLRIAHSTATDRAQQGEQLYQRLQQQFSFAPFCDRVLTIVRNITSHTP
jgi:glycosyltransferase involved in cell wall biosynthesis